MPSQQFVVPVSVDERIEWASRKLEAAINRTHEVIHIYEANQIILYSDKLTSQIPTSNAGVAFRIFSNTMFKGLIVKLSALWDRPDTHRNSIPTIVALAKGADVRTRAWENIVDNKGRSTTFSADEEDPELRAWLEKMSNDHTSNDADAAVSALDEAQTKAERIAADPKTRSLIQFRDFHVAHHLEEQAKDPALIGRYGEEKDLLDDTIGVLNGLNLGLRNSSFHWGTSFDNARISAAQLWGNCTFDIPTRQ